MLSNRTYRSMTKSAVYIACVALFLCIGLVRAPQQSWSLASVAVAQSSDERLPLSELDPAMAVFLRDLREMAERGSADAQFELAEWLFDGKAVRKDIHRAIEWYTEAANQGHLLALNTLGRIYLEGDGVPKDVTKAAEWYTKAAERGDVDAQILLGNLFWLGEHVPKDIHRAMEWYGKAAQQGDAVAQLLFGHFYHVGQGVAQDSRVAAEWYAKAAEQGNAGAQVFLGYMYQSGDGVPRDLATAFAWYSKAATQGEAHGQRLLGVAYELGQGVAKDMVKAIEWYSRAAEQGESVAQTALGVAYQTGNGLQKDVPKAIEWFTRAAEQGEALAQRALGAVNLVGDGIPKNTKLAIDWYTKAAEQGDAVAQRVLGAVFHKGDLVPRDMKESLRWLTKAAEQGEPQAQGLLGGMYHFGDGIPQDFERAYFWLNLSSANNLTGELQRSIRQLRDSVGEKLSPAQVVAVQKRCAEFKPITQKRSLPIEIGSPIPMVSASGSGFFISEDGYFVTNHHVVENSKRITVRTGGRQTLATVVATDRVNDLTILKCEGRFATLFVRGSSGLRMGDQVSTVGYPNPLLQGAAPKFTSGEVAAVSGPDDDPRLIQISAPIQPGNSGGALVDENGSVVGVIIGKLDRSLAIRATGEIPENVNYAIKGTILLALIESVPGLSGRLKAAPEQPPSNPAEVARILEAASAMVIVEK